MKTDVAQEVTSDSCLFVFQSREIKRRDDNDKPFKIIACGKYKCNAGNKQKKLYCTISICMCVCGGGEHLGGLYGEIKCIMGNGHMGAPPPHPLNRMTEP